MSDAPVIELPRSAIFGRFFVIKDKEAPATPLQVEAMALALVGRPRTLGEGLNDAVIVRHSRGTHQLVIAIRREVRSQPVV